jgi:hypothetical protein
MYFIDKTRTSRRALNSAGRTDDIRHLERELRHNPDPDARKAAHQALNQIKAEASDGSISSMRQSLIKAHRSNNQEEIKDIHDYASKKKKYHHE